MRCCGSPESLAANRERSVRRWFRLIDPIATPGQYHVVAGMSQSNAYFVESRMRIFWLKAQQIPAMKVVGKLGH